MKLSSGEPQPLDDLVSRLRTGILSPTYQPPLLPAVAVQLFELTRDSAVEFSTIQDLLETEPLLTASVLRLAQSAFYRRAEPIRTLEQAMRLLGLRTMADLFLQASASAHVFRARGFEWRMKTLQEHSVATAHVTRLVCQGRPQLEEIAFLAGLLHDVGIAAGLLLLANKGSAVRSRDEHDRVFAAVVEAHEWAGELLANAWRLPAEVVPALARHHTLFENSQIAPLAAAVCMAEYIVNDCDRGLGERLPSAQRLHAREALELTAEDDAGLCHAAGVLLARLREVP